MAKYRLTQYDEAGVSKPILLLLAYLGESVIIKKYIEEDEESTSQFLDLPAPGKFSRLEVRGTQLVQPSAICRFLGKKALLAGDTMFEAQQIDQAAELLMTELRYYIFFGDMEYQSLSLGVMEKIYSAHQQFLQIADVLYCAHPRLRETANVPLSTDTTTWKIRSEKEIRVLKSILKETKLPVLFKSLEEVAQKNGGFLGYKKLSWADFVFESLADVFDFLCGVEDVTVGYPHLHAIRRTVAELPQVSPVMGLEGRRGDQVDFDCQDQQPQLCYNRQLVLNCKAMARKARRQETYKGPSTSNQQQQNLNTQAMQVPSSSTSYEQVTSTAVNVSSNIPDNFSSTPAGQEVSSSIQQTNISETVVSSSGPEVRVSEGGAGCGTETIDLRLEELELNPNKEKAEPESRVNEGAIRKRLSGEGLDSHRSAPDLGSEELKLSPPKKENEPKAKVSKLHITTESDFDEKASERANRKRRSNEEFNTHKEVFDSSEELVSPNKKISNSKELDLSTIDQGLSTSKQATKPQSDYEKVISKLPTVNLEILYIKRREGEDFKYNLMYFGIRGLGESIRYLLAYMDENYQDSRVEYREWPRLELKTELGYLPKLITKNKTAEQYIAIARYLGKQANLAGTTPLEGWNIDVVAELIAESMKEVNIFLSPRASAKLRHDLRVRYISQLPKLLNVLEDNTEKHPDGFIASSKLTWVDFVFAAFTEFLIHVTSRDVIREYPKLEAIRTRIFQASESVIRHRFTRPLTEL